MSDGKGGSWSAKQASPALPVGLIGHSAVLYGSRVFIFGGLEMFTAPVALDPGGWMGGQPSRAQSSSWQLVLLQQLLQKTTCYRSCHMSAYKVVSTPCRPSSSFKQLSVPLVVSCIVSPE